MANGKNNKTGSDAGLVEELARLRNQGKELEDSRKHKKDMSRPLHESETRMTHIAAIIDDVLWMTDWPDHKILFCSPAYENIWGRSVKDLLENPLDWITGIHEDDRESVQQAFFKIDENNGYDTEFRVVRPDGSMRWVRDRGYPLRNDKNEVYRIVGIARDISERKQNNEEIRQLNAELELRVKERTRQLEEANKKLGVLSITDGLTGVYNRRFFNEILSKEWRRALRSRKTLSLLMIDIDFFKDYNDHYGHQDGDRCLHRVADALRNSVNRPGDLLARYGGEEFAILLPGTMQEGALHLAKNIRKNIDKLKLPHLHSEISDHVTVSIGFASMLPVKGHKPSILVKTADDALYQAKKQGRNRIIMK